MRKYKLTTSRSPAGLILMPPHHLTNRLQASSSAPPARQRLHLEQPTNTNSSQCGHHESVNMLAVAARLSSPQAGNLQTLSEAERTYLDGVHMGGQVSCLLNGVLQIELLCRHHWTLHSCQQAQSACPSRATLGTGKCREGHEYSRPSVLSVFRASWSAQ